MVQPTRNSEDQAEEDPDATILLRPEEPEKRTLPEVPGYDVTDHIGAGGMAHVWLAVDQNLK
ncbi:MAG: hypothetical protein VB949_18175, partial [Pseudomonadales bacterium]